MVDENGNIYWAEIDEEYYFGSSSDKSSSAN